MRIIFLYFSRSTPCRCSGIVTAGGFGKLASLLLSLTDGITGAEATWLPELDKVELSVVFIANLSPNVWIKVFEILLGFESLDRSSFPRSDIVCCCRATLVGNAEVLLIVTEGALSGTVEFAVSIVRLGGGIGFSFLITFVSSVALLIGDPE
jgi:hypothetical protein